MFVQAALTKYHRLGGLNHSTLFLTVLESGKSKIRLPAWSGPPGEDHLPGLHMAVILL